MATTTMMITAMRIIMREKLLGWLGNGFVIVGDVVGEVVGCVGSVGVGSLVVGCVDGLAVGLVVGFVVGVVDGCGVSEGRGVVVGLVANCDQVDVSTRKPLLLRVFANVRGSAKVATVSIRRALKSFKLYHSNSVYSPILVFYSNPEPSPSQF